MDILDRSAMRQIIIASVIFSAILCPRALAQLSPGELAQPHSFLEGLENCSKCHGHENKLSADKCLACHTEMKERVDAGLGLHALPDYRHCEVCHVEHQGRDYQLIWWKNGEEKFDHSLTGFALQGKHAEKKCRDCHIAKNIIIRERLFERQKDFGRTFLGLGRQCLNCHVDEHRGQFKAECLGCHAMAGWKPAAKFDHNKALFALTGKHLQVQCEKCHLPITDDKYDSDKSYLKFSGLRFGQCLDCHQDVHKNRFGTICATCHNTGDWHSVAQKQFDHSKTAFPLLGKHSTVSCDKCHAPGKPRLGLKFADCRDCHNDYHQGQLASRAGGGACTECHTVNGFTPTQFTVELHQKTDFALAGGHLAIPCVACHRKITTEAGAETILLKFENKRCQGCHQDPHKGQVDRFINPGGCEYCHKVEGWKAAGFDHQQTKFSLEGRHQSIECRSCHKPKDENAANLQFTGIGLQCQDCHQDIHRGQFMAESSDKTDCGRCHIPASWKPEKYDHNRDSAFKLNGAHLKVACEGCHKKTLNNEKPYILFKPLNTSCRACHSGKNIQSGGDRS